jgi:HEPN domain-containing protein
MRKEEVKILKERADAFLDTAAYNYRNGSYDLTAFNLEQAVQLYIKTKLLERIGEFPRTHNLVILLKELGAVYKENEVAAFIKTEMLRLTKLTDVYITSRYYTREFFKEEVKDLCNFAIRLKGLLDYL